MLYIGIDLGTSAVKLLLMDGNGEIKKIVSKNILCFSRTLDGQNKIRKIGSNNL